MSKTHAPIHTIVFSFVTDSAFLENEEEEEEEEEEG